LAGYNPIKDTSLVLVISEYYVPNIKN